MGRDSGAESVGLGGWDWESGGDGRVGLGERGWKSGVVRVGLGEWG